MIGALHDQFAVHDAAQPDADGGQFGREHLGVADHGGIGLAGAAACVLTYASMCSPPVSSSPSSRNFTLTGRLAGGLQQPFDGLDLDVDLALVVAGAARVDVVAAHFGLERRRLPLVQRIGRLHVVVAVEEDGRLAGRAQPLARRPADCPRLRSVRRWSCRPRCSSSRANSAARRISGLCSDSVLMLGMRRKVFRPSRKSAWCCW